MKPSELQRADAAYKHLMKIKSVLNTRMAYQSARDFRDDEGSTANGITMNGDFVHFPESIVRKLLEEQHTRLLEELRNLGVEV